MNSNFKFKATNFIYCAWYLTEKTRQEPLLPYPDSGNRWMHVALAQLTAAKLLPEWFAAELTFYGWFGECDQLNEILLWWAHGMAEATRRGFLMTMKPDSLMENEELELSEVETFGKYLRDYSRGRTPEDVKNANPVPAEEDVPSGEERTRESAS